MKKYEVTLTKVRSNHDNLRDDVIVGVTSELPEKGKQFSLLGKPRDIPFGFRSVTTTAIQNVEQMEKEYVFHTLNSTYKLEVTGELDTAEENSGSDQQS